MCRKNRKGTSFTTIPETLLGEVKAISKANRIAIRQIFDDAILELVRQGNLAGFTGWIPGRTPEPGAMPYNVRLGSDVSAAMQTALEQARVARDTFVVTALTRYVRQHQISH